MQDLNFSDTELTFNMPKHKSSPIKVIGVGGGGCNAVEHMFQQNIEGVDCIVCNTDAQHLEKCQVINKVYLGVKSSEGYGAGAKPERGNDAALESEADIKNAIEQNTKILFITSGMGGGTGTGASPVIARIAREMGILVVSVVTKPFELEGPTRMKNALNGIEELQKYSDSVIVINNETLVEQYGDFDWKDSFTMADQILEKATNGIAQVITKNYKINIDLEDVRTVLSNSGRAIMGYAEAAGEDRASKVIEDALNSPLLDDDDISGAKNVLLLLHEGHTPIKGRETKEICEYIRKKSHTDIDIIIGWGEDPKLEDKIAVTIVATGFSDSNFRPVEETIKEEQVIYSLDTEAEMQQPLSTDQLAEDSELVTTDYFNNDDENGNYQSNEEGLIDDNTDFYTLESANQELDTQAVNNMDDIDMIVEEKDKTEEEIKVYNLDDYPDASEEGLGLFVKTDDEKEESYQFEKKDEAEINLDLMSFGIPMRRRADKTLSSRVIERSKSFKKYNYRFKSNKGSDKRSYADAFERSNFIKGHSNDIQLSNKNSLFA